MQLLGGHIRGIARLVATPLNNPPLLLNTSGGVGQTAPLSGMTRVSLGILN